jgi:hypothetical protein
MLTYHTRAIDVVFFQFLNQSYNAMVNFYNRNTSAEVSNMQLLSAYLAASTTSVTVALYLNHYLGGAGSFLDQFVPFFAGIVLSCSTHAQNRLTNLTSPPLL